MPGNSDGRTVANAVVGFLTIAQLLLVNLYEPRWLAATGPKQVLWGWAANVVLIVVFLGVLGRAIGGRPAGILIDNRNRVSLSKFQAVAWTVMIVSALATIGAARAAAGLADPLGIRIPEALLAAMGISATSLLGSPVLLSLKAAQAPPPDEHLAASADRIGTSVDDAVATGRLFGRGAPAAAQWLDMFRGDEIANVVAPDLTKVQQFLMTLLILGVYAGGIVQAILHTAVTGPRNGLLHDAVILPAPSDTMIWLMGISHASYLAYKAVPHGTGGGSGAAVDAVG